MRSSTAPRSRKQSNGLFFPRPRAVHRVEPICSFCLSPHQLIMRMRPRAMIRPSCRIEPGGTPTSAGTPLANSILSLIPSIRGHERRWAGRRPPSARLFLGKGGYRRCCDNRLNLDRISRSATLSGLPRPGSSRGSAAMTTLQLRRSIAFIRSRSSIAVVLGERLKPSNMRRSNGSTGSITADCSSPSATSRPQTLKQCYDVMTSKSAIAA